MVYKFSARTLVVALITAISLCLTGWVSSVRAESTEELKAQLRAMQRQMMQMQKNMQALQDRINQLEAQKVAPAPAVEAGAVPSVWTKYNMKLYGKIKIDVNYDTAEFTRYNDFVGAVDTGDGHKNDSTNFNPRDTRFGFVASHAITENWEGLGRFEIDFYGDNNVDNLIPRMRLAYVDLANKKIGTSIRIGQDWIPVAQLNPSTVDFGILTAAGNLWWRVPQITVRQKVGDIELLGSLMKHRRKSTTDEDRMPWILARIAYTNGVLGEGNMIALGGGYRHGSYGTTDNTGTQYGEKNTDRWLICAEAKYGIGPVTIKGELWTGEGIGRNFLRYDLDMTEDGEAASAYGGWFDITYKVTDKNTVTVGYGFDNPNNTDIGDYENARRFTRNEQYFVNTWYSLSKALQVGAEWIYIETERHDEINTGNRFSVSMKYLF